MPSYVFDAAPRYHSGGIAGLAPDEVPAVLKRNEEVLTENDPRHRFNGGMESGAQPTMDVSIINTIDSESVVAAGANTRSGRQAIFNAIKAIVPHEVSLELYDVHAVTEGTDAQAEVTVRLARDGSSVGGRGADPDTLVASAKAYLAALNKLIARGGRLHAQAAE